MSRSYGGLAAADRVAGRRSALVAAGFQLVGTEGVTGLGMRAVCRQAGLSQKFFYESFEDVDALLHAVYAAALAQLELAVRPSLAAGLPGAFDAAARLMEEDPRVCRILLVEPIADRRLRGHVRETIPVLARAVLGDRVAGSPDDPRVRMRFSTYFGALISLFVEWTEGSLGDDRDAFVAHLVAVTEELMVTR